VGTKMEKVTSGFIGGKATTLGTAIWDTWSSQGSQFMGYAPPAIMEGNFGSRREVLYSFW
jgi:hypothetical protein